MLTTIAPIDGPLLQPASTVVIQNIAEPSQLLQVTIGSQLNITTGYMGG
jgi:hypothetical protein